MLIRSRQKQKKRLNGIFTTISPTSSLPSTYAGFPLDQDDWVCAQWDSYYERNKTALGQKKALEIFSIDTNRVGSFANLELCKFDCEFVKKFRALGWNITWLSTVYCGAEEVVEAGGEIISGAATGAKGFAGLLKFAPWILLGGAAYYYRDDIKKAFK